MDEENDSRAEESEPTTEAEVEAKAEELEYQDHGEGEENSPGAEDDHAQRSDVDAMGKDKRRQVVGGQYGATLRKQLTVYGVFVVAVLVVVVAFLTVVSSIDNRERALEETAPWTEATADQTPPRPIDFPRNGPQDTIPVDEIGQAVAPEESTRANGGGNGNSGD